MFSEKDRAFMEAAIEMAKKAAMIDEVPVGAVITLNDTVIGKGFNQVISQNDVSAHAEIIAIKEASKTINNYRLTDACIYVTLEPCHMCAKALIDARVSKLIYSASEPKTGSIESIDNMYEKTFNHKIEYKKGLFEEETSNMLKDFFRLKRN